MSITNLTWYQPKVRRIMRDVSSLKQREIAEVEGVTRQAVNNKLQRGTYKKELTNWIQILALAGYEINKREEQ